MSGDCGHGWGYHKDRSSPCSKCEEEEARAKIAKQPQLDRDKYKRQRDELVKVLEVIGKMYREDDSDIAKAQALYDASFQAKAVLILEIENDN